MRKKTIRVEAGSSVDRKKGRWRRKKRTLKNTFDSLPVSSLPWEQRKNSLRKKSEMPENAKKEHLERREINFLTLELWA